MDNTRSEKFSTIRSNQLVTLYTTPVWLPLLNMLRPTDIISLARATVFCLRPTEQQVNIYMQWWRQTFYNIKFVERNSIYCFGKDLTLLKSATHRWDYIEANKIKLLLLVKETTSLNEVHILRNALLESIGTTYMWHTNQNNLLSQNQLVQTCIIFFRGDIDVELDGVWSKDVCSEERRRLSGRCPFWTWFVDLRQPNLVNSMAGDNMIIHLVINGDNSVVGTVEFERTGYPLTVHIRVLETFARGSRVNS